MYSMSRPTSSSGSAISTTSSNKSQKKAVYSHLLYCSEAARDSFLYPGDMVSKFSSASTSPTSSIASFHSSTPASQASTKPSSTQSIPRSLKSLSVASFSAPKYADTHYPLITSTSAPPAYRRTSKDHAALGCARLMTLIHNTIIRALNSSYNHAMTVSPQQNLGQVSAFLFFNQAVYSFVMRNHQIEDEDLFPGIEYLLGRPGAMDGHMRGRAKFLASLEAWGAYIHSPATTHRYSGSEMQRLIESFAPALIQHLHDEVPSLSALAAVPRCDSAALEKVWARSFAIANDEIDLYVTAPWILGCQDVDFEIDGVKEKKFPPFPWVCEVLVRKWHARRHHAAWEFCPSTLTGQRKLLEA